MGHKNLDLVWDNIAQVKNIDFSGKSDIDNHADILVAAFSKFSEIRGQTIVIKLPGEIIESPEKLADFAKDIALLKSLDLSIVIVHDYSNLIPDILDIFGVKERLIENFKVSDHKSVQVMEMIISGYINKKIVSAINAAGASTVGISGKDSNLIQARKFNIAAKRVDDSASPIIDMGFIGEPVLVNPEILIDLEESDVVTVLSPIAYGENGESFLLDVNLTAAIIASSISASRLLILHPSGGIKVENVLVSEMKINDLKSIKNKMEFSRDYLDIVEASISSIENYTEFVHIIDSDIKHSILLNLFAVSGGKVGTIISM